MQGGRVGVGVTCCGTAFGALRLCTPCRDIDGTSIDLSTYDKCPMQRALAWQCMGAIDLAKDTGKLPLSFDPASIDLKV
jgi:hypothetical protein